MIKAKGVSDKNRYVKNVKLNGKLHTNTYLTHDEIMKGGVLEFEMASKPNKKRGINMSDKPYSLSTSLPD